MKIRLTFLAGLLALIFGPASAQSPGQEVRLQFTCDLGGAPAQMLMGVHYQNAFGLSQNQRGHISGVFPVGVNVYVGGEIRSSVAYYTFRGENTFADFVDHGSGNTFKVEWVLDPGRNGLWMKINPFGGTTAHFCQFNGVV